MSDQWKSFVAGATAGAVEGFATYPFEFAKTRLQLADKSTPGPRNPFSLIADISRREGVSALYTGSVAFVMGNTAKAGVRFLGFDTLKDLMRDENGHVSKMGGALAGLGAGVMESVLALTPAESIKTAMIDDRRSVNPRYTKGLAGNVRLMVQEGGFKALYRGLVPVTCRQAANQFVRLGSYNAFKAALQARKPDPSAPLSSLETFVLGAVVGTITVYATMPVDTVKTRMQSVDAKTRYRNSIHCLMKTARDDGVLALWKGSTARLGRLVFSGGIVFTVYEKVMSVLK